VLGTDKRAELGSEAARSDTLILLSVDPKWKTAGILSIPRDLQVTVPGYGLQKINAAYFFGEYNKIPGGGPALAVPTVSKFFNVPIDYYVSVNFAGFQKIVDEVGGIDVYVPETIDDPEYPGPYNSYIHVHFDAGCTHMDGEEALEYARTRHADSDFGRARRQQQVIRAVRDKALELNMLPRYPELLSQLGDSVETNIPPDKQLAFAQLASQIKASDIYMAQIDAGMVREVSDTGDLILNRAKAKPMLDWFFGRGKYASLRPGAVLTPTPTPTVKATATPAKRATATPTRSLDGVPVEPTETLEPTGPIADGLQPPPMGQCR
jgi:LCP family protein required for cell wall assembly